ncbi:centrosomal protein kizuna isoform X2 [Xyrauchen texanus]|uniref:centrosomal protein kizuna isoform X2 n=1 Tax=Xyrauchen texanus TaxID=154827 RepID=UPI0022421F23|nr:centrosomal protein kizuna isoform X2 [Xyrauchen texanus]
MAFCNTEYFDHIGNIQKSIHQRERRRYELEEKLFAYLRSEEKRTKLKCAKMRCYYKELHEREQRAKTRNLELLGNVDSLALELKEFSIDCSRLLQKRLEYKNHITRLKKDRKKTKSRGESEADEHPESFLLSSKWGSRQSAVIFTGNQTSNSSRHGVTTTHSPSETELIPNHPSFSPQQSGLLMHPHVSKASGAAVISDDILNSGDFLEGGRVSDMYEQQIESDWDISQRAGQQHRLEKLDSPRTTLKETEVSPRSVKRLAAIVSLDWCPTHSPSPVTTDRKDFLQYRNSGDEDVVVSAEDEGDSVLKRQDLADHSKSRRPSIPSPAFKIKPGHTDSDISVSPSQIYHGHHIWRGDVVIQGQNEIPTQVNRGTQENTDSEHSARPDSPKPLNRLSMEGLCHLLDYIEQRLSAKDIWLYRSSTINEQKLRDIISICSQCGSLDSVDVQACCAVVLQQLPLLSCSLSQGCLLPKDLINTHWSTATKPDQIRSCLSAYSALLWDRCFRHILQLQQQEILSIDLIVQLFTPLLVLNSATYSDKAGELLKRLLTYESAIHQPSDSEQSSSCSLPSLLDDNVEIKPARPSKKHPQTVQTQGIQTAEEDSADQSPVESIPIRGKMADRRIAHLGVLLCPFCLSPNAVDNGDPFFARQDSCEKNDQGESEVRVPPEVWNSSSNFRQRKQTRLFSSSLETKAYQLLKQSVAQERHWSDSEEEDSEPSGRVKKSSHSLLSSQRHFGENQMTAILKLKCPCILTPTTPAAMNLMIFMINVTLLRVHTVKLLFSLSS